MLFRGAAAGDRTRVNLRDRRVYLPLYYNDSHTPLMLVAWLTCIIYTQLHFGTVFFILT